MNFGCVVILEFKRNYFTNKGKTNSSYLFNLFLFIIFLFGGVLRLCGAGGGRGLEGCKLLIRFSIPQANQDVPKRQYLYPKG